ncbi:hypothetical protein J2Z28_000483 [Paenibacillus xylanexedens]|uniref:Uncharacterized protein n=1 Tax=Paenibacillus xylanexedens TaxID=528191 RepID=A0ABS4RLU1_PAEXY|nr:hypothetical protein [Paenibacillus xylanexedens]
MNIQLDKTDNSLTLNPTEKAKEQRNTPTALFVIYVTNIDRIQFDVLPIFIREYQFDFHEERVYHRYNTLVYLILNRIEYSDLDAYAL